MDIRAFWKDVITQNRDALRAYFSTDAIIRWPCTNEQFTVDRYISVNCDYPGNWEGEIERIEERDPAIILAGRVYPPDRSVSFHVVSFIRLENGLITEMDEYWAEDGEPPTWRREND